MPSDNTKSHHEDLRKAILFNKEGDIDRAKQQLNKILEQVNDTWDAEEVRVRARSLAEQIHRKEGLVKSPASVGSNPTPSAQHNNRARRSGPCRNPSLLIGLLPLCQDGIRSR